MDLEEQNWDEQSSAEEAQLESDDETDDESVDSTISEPEFVVGQVVVINEGYHKGKQGTVVETRVRVAEFHPMKKMVMVELFPEIQAVRVPSNDMLVRNTAAVRLATARYERLQFDDTMSDIASRLEHTIATYPERLF